MKEFDYSIDKSVFLSKSNFSEYIENMILKYPHLTYFDAILKFSDESDKEPIELVQYMSDVLLAKVKQSAVESDLIQSNTPTFEELL
ncbi:hypothetical protein GW931_04140 [archaeon]|nr:hypothetical protein [archaeon]